MKNLLDAYKDAMNYFTETGLKLHSEKVELGRLIFLALDAQVKAELLGTIIEHADVESLGGEASSDSLFMGSLYAQAAEFCINEFGFDDDEEPSFSAYDRATGIPIRGEF